MRKSLLLAAVAATAMMVLPSTAPAWAATTAAKSDVLTTGKVGGPDVAVKAKLHAVLETHQELKFSAGGVTLTCAKSTLTATVKTNPARPATVVASPALTAGQCTAEGVSVSVTFSLGQLTQSDAKTDPVTLSKPALTFSAFGVTCKFSAPKLSATASNAGSELAVKAQTFTPLTTNCPISGSGSLAAITFGPVEDSSVTGTPHVFVN
jgi:hypothetical protein